MQPKSYYKRDIRYILLAVVMISRYEKYFSLSALFDYSN